MGLLFSRVGTDSFYSGLDNQFKKISANVALLQEGKAKRKKVWNSVRNRFFAVFLAIYVCILAYAAWIIQQPAGTYTPTQHAKRVSPAFISPILAYTVYSVFSYLQSSLDKRADEQIKKHEIKLKKMISDLKDTTKYQKTQQLLEKYDPDFHTTIAAAAAYVKHTPTKGIDTATGEDGDTTTALTPLHPNTKQQSMVPPLSVTANRAATAVTGAGIKLSAALGQLWAQAADTLISDDPTLIAMLEQAQAQAAALERENVELRSMLGFPPKALNFNSIEVPSTTTALAATNAHGDEHGVESGADGDLVHLELVAGKKDGSAPSSLRERKTRTRKKSKGVDEEQVADDDVDQ